MIDHTIDIGPTAARSALAVAPWPVPTTIEGRLAVTVAIGLVVVTLLWLARRSRTLTDDLTAGVAIDLLRSSGILLTVGLATWTLVETWGLEASLTRALGTVVPTEEWLPRAALTGLVLVAMWVAVGVLRRFLSETVESYGAVDRHRQEVIYRVSQVTLVVIGGLVVLALWRVNLGGLLVGAGVAGVVIGLAARQTLGAVIAGFVLMFSRPFEIGDWVAIADHEGFVTGITIFNTRLQTVDAEEVVVPNDEVTSDAVVNYTGRGRLRVRVPISVDYETDLARARSVALEALTPLEDVLAAPKPTVVATEFGDSGIGLEVRFWIDRPSPRKRWRTRTAVVEAVKSAYDEAGITIPFPQRTVGSREAGTLESATGRTRGDRRSESDRSEAADGASGTAERPDEDPDA